MSVPSRDPDDAEDIAALVSELETTLSRLRTELDDRGAAGRRDADARAERTRGPTRRGRRRDEPPRPPAVSDLARFTSDYTIPTVVAVLEATIEALELLQGVIDLTAPGRTPDRRPRRDRSGFRGRGGSLLSDALADGVSSATDRAATDAADALGRLRDTLSEADLPEDAESRDLVADARELSAELERRVRESRETVDRERRRERGDRQRRGPAGPVRIEVGDPEGGSKATDADAAVDAETDESGTERPDGEDTAETDAGDGEDRGTAPEVDVDAELESIKRQMGDRDAGDADDGGDGGEGTDSDKPDGADDDAA